MNEICPVSGKPCSKSRPFHITEIDDNKKVHSLNLCEDCVHEYIKSGKAKNVEEVTPAQMVQSIFDVIKSFAQAIQSGKSTTMPTCPKCGITAKEVQEIGRFGCPDCYEHLAPPQLMKHIHGSTKHVGKVPKRWKEEQEKSKLEKRKKIPLDFRIKGLEARINQAAKLENYELASEIKKAIDNMKEIQQEIEMLKFALHTATQDDNKKRASELTDRISEAENKCLKIELSALD